MSNSSESLLSLHTLLEGIAQECSVLGSAIAETGGDISGELSHTEAASLMAKFQSFDLLSQNAHAQARLLARITGLLCAGGDTSNQQLLEMLEDMPIHDVRHRLRALLGAPQDDHPGDEAEIW